MREKLRQAYDLKKKERERKFGYRYCFSPKKRNEEIEILRETFITKRERYSTHKLYIGTVWFLESIRERENFHKEFHFLLFGANSLCLCSFLKLVYFTGNLYLFEKFFKKKKIIGRS